MNTITVTAGCLLSASPAMIAPRNAGAATAKLTVDVNRPGAKISPLLYGIFFEEINRAGDGGIYAEMVQNRSFEDAEFPVAWKTLTEGGAAGSARLDRSVPLNANNPTSLRLEITKVGGRVGIANEGFGGVAERPRERPEEWATAFDKAKGGIAVERGKAFDLSLYARSSPGFTGPLTVSLERTDGTVLASQRFSNLDASWKPLKATLSPNATYSRARLVLWADTPGTVWLDMVSLFPRNTFKGRPNGLRNDLMQTLAAMKPAFVRFPGGCFVEGQRMADATRWKETVGDLATRSGHWNLWGYRSTDGLGYYEYLQMCEDFHAEPLFVINVGMAHEDHVPLEAMKPYVQDALDAVEYANGPVTSRWGAMRAKAGHPAPFGLKYMEIGNENGGPVYNERFALFHDALKAKYPNVNLVADDWGGTPASRPYDLVDMHMYSDPSTFLQQSRRFDAFPRKGPKVYFGEYAVTSEAGAGNAQAALAEAAFMTGLERNGDVVAMSSYAPLLSRPSWKVWNPNAIVYDSTRQYGTPSYHVQAMFSANRADRLLPLKIEAGAAPVETPRGRIGVGTWNTQAEYKDIRVTKGGQTLYASDFTKGTGGWTFGRGSWKATDGVLRQTNEEEGDVAFFGDAGWSDYTLSLKARKLGGREGFLISFQSQNPDTKSWWNLGGWNNTMHGLELPGMGVAQAPGKIETGRWYDVKIELRGPSVNCYLDGKLVQKIARKPEQKLFAVAGTDERTGETVLKVVNAGKESVNATLDLRGAVRIGKSATALVMAAPDPLAENSFARPRNVAPRHERIPVSGPAFRHTFPAYSVTVLRVRTGK